MKKIIFIGLIVLLVLCGCGVTEPEEPQYEVVPQIRSSEYRYFEDFRGTFSGNGWDFGISAPNTLTIKSYGHFLEGNKNPTTNRIVIEGANILTFKDINIDLSSLQSTDAALTLDNDLMNIIDVYGSARFISPAGIKGIKGPDAKLWMRSDGYDIILIPDDIPGSKGTVYTLSNGSSGRYTLVANGIELHGCNLSDAEIEITDGIFTHTENIISGSVAMGRNGIVNISGGIRSRGGSVSLGGTTVTVSGGIDISGSKSGYLLFPKVGDFTVTGGVIFADEEVRLFVGVGTLNITPPSNFGDPNYTIRVKDGEITVAPN
jgi:hypothetical protein